MSDVPAADIPPNGAAAGSERANAGGPAVDGGPRREVRSWVAAGLLAGVLDIVFACAYWAIAAGVPVRRPLQGVASGLLGRRSFEGGYATAALGLALHLSIAIVMAATYFAVSRRLPVLRRRPWVFGPLYGLALYAVMNLVVVPLSAAGPGSREPGWIALGILAHAVLVGLPIALLARRASASRGGAGGARV